jgi:ribosomal-protein-alanine N-acetyltransferase
MMGRRLGGHMPMAEIQTHRLQLIPLSIEQLKMCLNDLEQLEQEFDIVILQQIFSGLVRRGLSLKPSKMAQTDAADHPWHTYWLMVVTEQKVGAGLLGFRGTPDQQGEAEISYSLSPDNQYAGHMTEAVRALITWAFESPHCQSIIVPAVAKTNMVANRIYEKAGMHVYGETESERFWRIDREDVE